MAVEALTVSAHDIVTGRMLVARIPFTGCSWSDSISEPGSMSVDVDYTTASTRLDLYGLLRPWRVILALRRGATVVHAGPVTSRSWDPASRRLSLTCGGGWTLLSRRLVLNHGLASSFRDGEVLIDDDHPAGDWLLALSGSYRDIIRGLVAETMKWGAMPFTLPAVEGGAFARSYNGADLATVADRISDISDLESGVEVRFPPSTAGGVLSYGIEAAHELVDHYWKWNTLVPGQRVMLTGFKEDGDDLANDVWATGGKNDDRVLMARAVASRSGYPPLQAANTQHTTVSVLATLQSYARAQANTSPTAGETWELKVGEEWPVHVGDWTDIRVADDLLGDRVVQLKITDVSGSADSDWLTIQARRR
ncbi:hypothetical protein [Bifidobacterium simiiventris]|uniref:hypothetical protein n=1 Tax=Bifidobacterium simiiventris TaxID=2834434 RepID=UPI001C55C1E8|nr:hypothetical protein [Bifidobacterium simiiventris]MBW3077684.1 hypothetical protein [Bifidobacterium simiiventris]